MKITEVSLKNTRRPDPTGYVPSVNHSLFQVAYVNFLIRIEAFKVRVM